LYFAIYSEVLVKVDVNCS